MSRRDAKRFGYFFFAETGETFLVLWLGGNVEKNRMSVCFSSDSIVSREDFSTFFLIVRYQSKNLRHLYETLRQVSKNED